MARRQPPTPFGSAREDALALRDLRGQVARLEAANAAKDAALRCYGGHGIDCNWTAERKCCCGFTDALSDGGEGWLEVREQVRRAIEVARRHGSFEHGWVVARLAEAADALDALGGK